MDKIIFTGSKYALYFNYWETKKSIFGEEFRFSQIGAFSEHSKGTYEIHKFQLEDRSSKLFERIANNNDSSLFVLITSVFAILLKEYTGKKKIIVDTPLYNNANVKDVNYSRVPLLIEVKGGSLEEYLKNVKEVIHQSYTYQNYPLSLISENGIDDIYKTNVLLVCDSVHLNDIDTRSYDFVVLFKKNNGGLELNLKYKTNLYDDYFIKNIETHFNQTASHYFSLKSPLEQLPIFAATEKNLLLNVFNSTATDSNCERTMPEIFEAQVQKNPEAIAVIFESKTLTYRELNEKANILANQLIETYDLNPDDLVGVMLDRSELMIVAILGVLKSGCAYLPIDPNYPQERIVGLLSDAQVKLLITASDLIYRIPSYEYNLFAIDIHLTGENINNVRTKTDSSNLAYVIFTSGSTGVPNGVMVEHRNVSNLIFDQIARLSITSDDRVLQFASLSFDASVLEIFSALLSGAALVLIKKEFVNDPSTLIPYLKKKQVSIIAMAASFFNLIDLSEIKSLRVVMTGGEAPNVEKVSETKTFSRYINAYGPTECCVNVSTYEVAKNENFSSVPIGSPISNVKVYILGDDLQLLPIGVEGEICVSGAGIARGYIYKSEQSKLKFIENPFAVEGHKKLYRTGDIGKWLPNGCIEFVGRKDSQLKVRGFRVSPEEIEQTIRKHPAIKNACVYLNESNTEKSINAVVTIDDKSKNVLHKLLRLKKDNKQLFSQLHELSNGLQLLHLNRKETEYIYSKIFKEGIYAKNGIEINEGDVIFDVGANIGMFSLSVLQSFENITVFAFEPIKPVFDLLEKNLNFYSNKAIALNCGLSNSNQKCSFLYYPKNTISAEKYTNEGDPNKSFSLEAGVKGVSEESFTKKVEGSVTRISDIIIEYDLKEISLLKIGVEKSGLEIIEGINKEDWRKIRQVVILASDNQLSISNLTGKLEEEGFDIVVERQRIYEGGNTYVIYASRLRKNEKHKVEEDVIRASSRWLNPSKLVQQITELCQQNLPDYMVPAKIKLIDELPLTINGKINFKALGQIKSLSLVGDRELVKPRNKVEEEIFALWAKVLDSGEISVRDNFFEIGGNSLKIIRLLELCNDIFPDKIKTSDLFDFPTIEEQGKIILKQQESEAFSEIEVIEF